MSSNRTAREELCVILKKAKHAGIHQASLATEAGVAPSTISRWLSTAIEPRMSSLHALRDAYTRLRKFRHALARLKRAGAERHAKP